jgi:multidrug efflux pump subunit AcrA (membrane-fusion protein)
MRTPSTQPTVEVPEPAQDRRQSRRRRWLVAGALSAVLVAAGVMVLVTGALTSGQSSGAEGNGTGTSLAEVEQRSLSSQTSVSGTLGYAGAFDVVLADLAADPTGSEVLAAEQAVASAEAQLKQAEATRAQLDSASDDAIALAEQAVRQAQSALAEAQRAAQREAGNVASAQAALLAEELAYCNIPAVSSPSFCPAATAVPISYSDEQALAAAVARGTPEPDAAHAASLLAANASYKNAVSTKASADAAVELASADLTAAQSDLSAALGGPSAADIGGADAAVAAARKALEAARAKLAELNQGQGSAQGGQADGTVTALPTVGQVVKQDEVLYRVDGSPVVLLYGSTPAHRDMRAGDKGPDGQQLNANLVALGYASASELDPNSNEFTDATTVALKKLQAALGMEQTGVLAFGQVVFLPSAIRVTSVPVALGATVQPGATVLKATSTTPVVTVKLDPARQSQVKQGDAVTVTLPNLKTTPGTVLSVGTVATAAPSSEAGGGAGDPTIAVEIVLTDPTVAGGLDQAPVLVNITTATVDDALVVPVTALLALAGGGYAVEVVGSDGVHTLVPVTLGIFDDAAGLVQVISTGLAAGQQVVVPGT